jgi:hypothetical protein
LSLDAALAPLLDGVTELSAGYNDAEDRVMNGVIFVSGKGVEGLE